MGQLLLLSLQADLQEVSYYSHVALYVQFHTESHLLKNETKGKF